MRHAQYKSKYATRHKLKDLCSEHDYDCLGEGGIYAIVNLADKKRTAYVGSTVYFEFRWAKHLYLLRREKHTNKHLQNAYNKYGEDSFWFQILEVLYDESELWEREQYWLDHFRDKCPLYNKGRIARTPWLGQKHSPETRMKISEAGKGRTWRKAQRQKFIKARKGHPVTKETRKKLARATSKPYPAFFNELTGGFVPSSVNLIALTESLGLVRGTLHAVKNGQANICKGWRLATQDEILEYT